MRTTIFLGALALAASLDGCERQTAPLAASSGFFAFAEPQAVKPDPVVKERPRLRKQAFYKVSIQGVPVGTAVAARNETTQVFPSSVALRLVHRLGASAVASDIVVEARVSPQGEDVLDIEHSLGLSKERLLSETTPFRRTQGMLVQIVTPAQTSAGGSDVTTMLPRAMSLAPAFTAADAEHPVAMETQAFFRLFDATGKVIVTEPAKIVNPLTGKSAGAEGANLIYDDDGFLRSGNLRWHGALELAFTRTEEASLEAYGVEVLKTPLELAWFSTEDTLAADVRRLQADAQACATFSRDAENQVRREFPQLPYLMHRRVYNFGILCSRLATLLAKSDGRAGLTKALDDVHWIFGIVLAEDKQELPKGLLAHPDVPVVADVSRRWQWTRAASQILRGAHEELAGLIALERAQKVNLSMRILIDRLTPGSVVKGVLRAKDVRFKSEVRIAEGNKARTTSWLRVPESLVRPLRLASRANANVKIDPPLLAASVPFELLHGQAFARGEAMPVGAVCENFQGRVGLDLGDAPNGVISGAFARGVWDDSLRLGLVREFAQRAGSHPACRQVIFSVPKKMVAQVKLELDAFDKNILQSESEFQISNRNMRRMRVQPGMYELTLTSLVSGEVIGVRDIVVPEGKPSLAVTVKF